MKIYDDNNKLTIPIQINIEDNKRIIKELLDGNGDIVAKNFALLRQDKCTEMYIVYIDGLADNEMIENTILKPLLYEWKGHEEISIEKAVMLFEAQTVDIKKEKSFDKTMLAILKGDTAIFIDGLGVSFLVSTKKYPLRGIAENTKEPSLNGAKDSFNEGFRQSTALIRRRIRDAKLKCEQGEIGTRSRTDYALMYLSDVVMPGLPEKVKGLINKIDIDAIFDSSEIAQLLEKNKKTPFPIIQSTSRPDKVASAIAEGRLAIVVDNSPEVLLVPATLNMMLQSADDYYNRSIVASFARIIRYIAALIAIGLPGLYVALTMHASYLIPEKLLYAIVYARTSVTGSVMVEVLLMEFFFELLREAGLRLPGQLGNTIGVVGGLIVGDAAVQAGLVTTTVVIVVSLTAISAFTLPNEEFSSIFRLLKFAEILLSAALGLYGFALGLLILITHLSGVKSFGVPYLLPMNKSEYKDYFLRRSITEMYDRPSFAKDKKRMKGEGNQRNNNKIILNSIIILLIIMAILQNIKNKGSSVEDSDYAVSLNVITDDMDMSRNVYVYEVIDFHNYEASRGKETKTVKIKAGSIEEANDKYYEMTGKYIDIRHIREE